MLLRDYQKDMLDRLHRAWERHRSVMVQMPTGTGKTFLMAEAIRSEERRVKNRLVFLRAMVFHTLIETCKQTSIMVKDYLTYVLSQLPMP